MMKSKVVFFAVSLLLIMLGSCKRDTKTKVEDEVATVRTKEYRSVTVINGTSEKLMTECNLTTEAGALVKHKKLDKDENIVFDNFDEIGGFANESWFKITLIDRFGLKYEKVFMANPTGNTDVTLTDENYIEQPGDWKRKIERTLNK